MKVVAGTPIQMIYFAGPFDDETTPIHQLQPRNITKVSLRLKATNKREPHTALFFSS